MCKYMDSDCYCVLKSDTCDKKSCYECEVYISYEEMIRE